LTFGTVAPVHAASVNYGFGGCGPQTVVSVTTSTVNADHVNVQGSNARYSSWNDLFIFIPETRRAYPNWTYVNSTALYTGGYFASTGRECG
jgi:hypothetical protein